MQSVAIEHFYKEDDSKFKVEWNISKRCNFNCSYCSPFTHDNVSEWKNIKDYKSAVDKIVNCTDKEIWLSFTGGEPCLYPDFEDLIKYCKEKGITFVSVCSNGSMKPSLYLRLMEYLDNIIISYHFEYKVNVLETILEIQDFIKDKNKNLHVHIMMLPGHFDKAVEVIKVLKQSNVLFGIRRIRPLFMPDGSFARPYQLGGSLNIKDGDPKYSDTGYYSDEELEFFRGQVHDYL